MVRKAPCQYCKRRRRKCEQPDVNEPCARCRRMGKKCIPQDPESTECSSSDEFDGCSDELKAQQYEFMQNQVEFLENQIQHLEIAIADQKALTTRQEPQWNITVTDGEVRLHSKIRTLEEFMLYRQAALRYLSPFSGTFRRNSLVFERVEPSLVTKFANLALRLQYANRNSIDQLSKYTLVSKNNMNGSSQFIHSTSVIDSLIDSYFRCVNKCLPIVHEATFRHFYGKCRNEPFKGPFVAAICCNAAMNTCEHALFNPMEKRYISEHFYNIAIDQLIEIFDEPNHALEALVSINLLYRFMVVTLRVKELRKWTSIASVIANNLKREMEPYQSIRYDHPHLRVKSTITERNCLMALCVSTAVEVISAKRDDRITPKNIQLDILPDETGLTREFIETFNHILELLNSPVIVNILTQTRSLIFGNEVEFGLDELMRYEEVLIEWWHGLPDSIKLTKEPYNCTIDIIKKCTNLKQLVLCGYVHIMTLGMQSSFIQPKLKDSSENITNIVRERALGLIFYSAEISLATSNQISSLPGVCLSPVSQMIRVIDTLLTIIKSQDGDIEAKARSMLKRCMTEMDEIISSEHHVSSILSPIYAENHASDSVSPDLYFKYPLPAAALVYDVIQNSVDRL